MAHCVSVEADRTMMTGSEADLVASCKEPLLNASRLPGWSGEEFFRYMSKVGILKEFAGYTD